MNVCVFTGKIYNLQFNEKEGREANVRFSLGVRKSYLSEKDKTAGKTLNFIPCNLWGERAEWVSKYFNDGDFISVVAEYEPYENQNKQLVPQFKVIKADFPAGVQNHHGNGSESKPEPKTESKSSTKGEKTTHRSRRSFLDEDDSSLPF